MNLARVQLLPLKWGISTMVLGAMAKYQGPEPLKVCNTHTHLAGVYPSQVLGPEAAQGAQVSMVSSRR